MQTWLPFDAQIHDFAACKVGDAFLVIAVIEFNFLVIAVIDFNFSLRSPEQVNRMPKSLDMVRTKFPL